MVVVCGAVWGQENITDKNENTTPIYHKDGKVGIGTTSIPLETLDVNGTIKTSNGIKSTYGSFSGRVFSTGSEEYGNLSGTNGAILMSYRQDTQVGYLSTRNYIGQTNTKMYLSASAIGINKTPFEALDVSGNIQADGNITVGQSSYLKLTRPDGNVSAQIGFNSNNYDFKFVNSSGNGFFTFHANISGTVAERARITNAGYLKLAGGGNPTEALDVNGNVSWKGSLLLKSSNGERRNFYHNTSSTNSHNYMIWQNTGMYIGGPSITFRTNGGTAGIGENRLKIDEKGNVGIGTNEPSQKLHIQGSPWTGIKIQDVTKTGGRGVKNEYIDGNNDGWEMFFGGHYPGQPLRFRSINKGQVGVDVFTLYDNGNIGIGTTSPSAKLDVEGKIKAHEIEVTLAAMQDLQLNGTLAANKITYTANGNTADFVFEDNYHLKDLTEVEAFIKTNKHLPEIPSAAEMEEAGVNLAEMNKLLLMKVEELTLYSIQLEKEVKRQKVEVGKVRSSESEVRKEIEELRNMVLELAKTPNP